MARHQDIAQLARFGEMVTIGLMVVKAFLILVHRIDLIIQRFLEDGTKACQRLLASLPSLDDKSLRESYRAMLHRLDREREEEEK